MVDLYSTALIAAAIVIAGIIAIRAKISSSIIEVIMGVILANVLLVKIESWLEFLATFGGPIDRSKVSVSIIRERSRASGANRSDRSWGRRLETSRDLRSSPRRPV